jgi:hypothetical protein
MAEMTRGELVAELLSTWEKAAVKAQAEGYELAAGELRTAISVLERTYNGTELME